MVTGTKSYKISVGGEGFVGVPAELIQVEGIELIIHHPWDAELKNVKRKGWGNSLERKPQ